MKKVHVFCFEAIVVKNYGELYRITEPREILKLKMLM